MKPDLIGFSWELEEAIDLLWTPRTLDKPEGLDLQELRWWLARHDCKELRNLVRRWKKRKSQEYLRANAEHRALGGWNVPPCDLRRLGVLEWTLEQAYRSAFIAESGGQTPEEARAQGYNA